MIKTKSRKILEILDKEIQEAQFCFNMALNEKYSDVDILIAKDELVKKYLERVETLNHLKKKEFNPRSKQFGGGDITFCFSHIFLLL